jgi:hypothetical protein
LSTISVEASGSLIDNFSGIFQDPNPNLASSGVTDYLFVLLPLSIAAGVSLLFMAFLINKSEDIAKALISGGGAGSTGFIGAIQRGTKGMLSGRKPDKRGKAQRAGAGNPGRQARPTAATPQPRQAQQPAANLSNVVGQASAKD